MRCTKVPLPWTGWHRNRKGGITIASALPPASGTFPPTRDKVADTKTIQIQHHRYSGSRGFYRGSRNVPACTGWFAGPVLRRIWCRASVRNRLAPGQPLPVPRIGFVNKMDRSGADFLNVVKQVKEMLRCESRPCSYRSVPKIISKAWLT